MKEHVVFKYDNMVQQFQTMVIIMFVDNVLYDKAAFYTNAEYETLSGIKMDVQSFIETPELYLFEKC